MTQRGRGTLEINPSKNPFFQTTSSDIGAKITERAQMDWERPSGSGSGSRLFSSSFEQNNTTSNNNSNTNNNQNSNSSNNLSNNYGEDFSFLYTRSSDTIGSKIDKKPNALALCMDTHSVKHKRLQENGANIVSRDEKPVKKDVETILQSYKHQPKDENPLYTTSGNDYGRKAPSIATYVSDRAFRPQDFSKSFNGIKPKNSSLNTSITKSTVHPRLDPQFM